MSSGTSDDPRSTPPALSGGREVELLAHLRQRIDQLESENENLRRVCQRAMRAAEEHEITQDQLRQTQKMEAIGSLADGIAHDMNNVLGAIMTLASVLREDLAEDNSQRQDIDDILSAVKRGKDITRNLLGFASRGKYRREPLSLNDIVDEVKEELVRELPDGVRLKLYLHDELPSVVGDYTQLSRVVTNVCSNAVEAMDQGGELTIGTHCLDLIPSDLKAWPDLEPGEYIALEVIDTGQGMQREVLDRAFEPFFTTKDQEVGKGLGLAMVYGAIKNHDGAVTIDSYLGTGTKVTIMLPADAARPSRQPGSGPLETVSAEVAGPLLVVDDDPLIRRSAWRALTKLGYEVLSATNGAEAVDLVIERKEEIELVILDLKMPVMDGETAFIEIRSIAPRLPILIASGFSRDDTVQELLDAGAAGFIQKPFSMRSLSQQVALAIQPVGDRS